MRIELQPPAAVPPVSFGAPFEEAVRLAGTWGEVSTSGPTRRSPAVTILAQHAEAGCEITVHCSDGERVSAVEVWRPEAADPGIDVRYEDRDVFRTPAREFLDWLRQRGHEVNDEDPEYVEVPGVTLAFTRDTSQEVPLDPADGLPRYFTSVLAAPRDYYD